MHQLSIPPLLRGTQIGSFAEHSIVSRLPETALRVISENNFDARTNERIRILAFDLPHGLIKPLTDEQAPDFLDWQKALQRFLGYTWLEVPLFFAEVYFYRRNLGSNRIF